MGQGDSTPLKGNGRVTMQCARVRYYLTAGGERRDLWGSPEAALIECPTADGVCALGSVGSAARFAAYVEPNQGRKRPDRDRSPNS